MCAGSIFSGGLILPKHLIERRPAAVNDSNHLAQAHPEAGDASVGEETGTGAPSRSGPSPSSDGWSADSPSWPGRVLIIDDSPLSLEVVSDLMQERGWQVESAGSGTEAMEKMRSSDPEVVVCDLNMPDLHGLECLKQIRKNKVLDGIKVIMYSNDQVKNYRDAATVLNAKSLRKSIDFNKSCREIASIINPERN